MNDTGARKFGVSLAIATAAAAGERWDVALAIVCVYTGANVLLKLFGKSPEAAE